MFKTFKGWIGEKMTSIGMSFSLDRKIYRRIDDLILPTEHGTTRIDHVIVSRYGIFVVETKNMRGWILGSEADAEWTQVNSGRKTRFQNPLRQNYRHTCAVAEKLNVDHDAVLSIVFFVGGCRFMKPVPRNVLAQGLASYICQFGEVRFSDVEVDEFEASLRETKQFSGHTMADHINSLRDRRESEQLRPKRRSGLVKRTV